MASLISAASRAAQLLLLLLIVSGVSASSIVGPRESIPFNSLNPNAVEITDYYLCRRAFTTAGATGCGSSSLTEGNRGTLYDILSNESLVEFETDGTIKDVTIVLNNSLFNHETVVKLMATNRVQSLLVLSDASTPPDSFSPATASSENPGGSGLADLLIKFPIALLGESSSDVILEKAVENRNVKFQENAWQHALDFTFFQGPQSATSEFCFEQERCLPSGGFSVWGTAGRFPSAEKAVMLATHLDATAIFKDLAFGAESTASGIIALLGAIHALGQVRSSLAALDKQIIFAFFQSETNGRLGSKRFVYDVTNGCLEQTNTSCLDPPIYNLAWADLNFSNIEEVVVVDQVANYYKDEKNEYFIHSTSENSASLALNKSQGASLKVSLSPGSVPQSPLDSFLESSDFKGVGAVLSGYDSTYDNPYYGSRFDRRFSDADSAAQELTDVATLLAKTALELAGDTVIGATIEANLTVITALESCLTRDFVCDLVQQFLGLSASEVQSFAGALNIANAQVIDPVLPSFYPGIYQAQAFLGDNINSLVPLVSHFVRNFAAYHTEPMLLSSTELEATSTETACISNIECAGKSSVVACNDTRVSSLACIRQKCMCVSTHFQDAYSIGLNVSGEGFSVLDPSFAVPSEVAFSDSIPTLVVFQASQGSTVLFLYAGGSVGFVASLVIIWFVLPRFANTKYRLKDKVD